MKKAIFCSACLLFLTGLSLAAEPVEGTRTLSVVGVGDIKMTPDVARIAFTIEAESKDAAAAVAQNDSQTARMLGSLSRFEVPDSDVKTTGYTIYPYTKRDPENYNRILGTFFRVTHNLTVTLRNLSLLGDVMSEATSLDSETSFHVSLDVGDKSGAHAAALASAVADARNKAAIMAAAEGREVGEVLSMNSNLSEVVATQTDGREAFADTSIAPGQTSIGVRVNVVFELK